MHCADNPADLPSRGMSFTQLTTSRLLKEGPDWLTNTELGEYIDGPMPEEGKKKKLLLSLVVLETTPRLGQLVDCQRSYLQ